MFLPICVFFPLSLRVLPHLVALLPSWLRLTINQSWDEIAAFFPEKSASSCQKRFHEVQQDEIDRFFDDETSCAFAMSPVSDDDDDFEVDLFSPLNDREMFLAEKPEICSTPTERYVIQIIPTKNLADGSKLQIPYRITNRRARQRQRQRSIFAITCTLARSEPASQPFMGAQIRTRGGERSEFGEERGCNRDVCSVI